MDDKYLELKKQVDQNCSPETRDNLVKGWGLGGTFVGGVGTAIAARNGNVGIIGMLVGAYLGVKKGGEEADYYCQESKTILKNAEEKGIDEKSPLPKPKGLIERAVRSIIP